MAETCKNSSKYPAKLRILTVTQTLVKTSYYWYKWTREELQ